jgi:hypothetical protein
MKNTLIEIFPFQLHFFHFIKSLFNRQQFLSKSDKSKEKKDGVPTVFQWERSRLFSDHFFPRRGFFTAADRNSCQVPPL